MKPRNAALAKIKNIHTPNSVLLEEIIAGPVIAFRRTVLGLSKGLGEAECREIVGAPTESNRSCFWKPRPS